MYHERRHPYRGRDNSLGQEGVTARSRNHWIIGTVSNGEFREFPNMPHFVHGAKGKQTAEKVASSIKTRYGEIVEARYFEITERYLALREVGLDEFLYVNVEHGVEDGDHASDKKTIRLHEGPDNKLGID